MKKIIITSLFITLLSFSLSAQSPLLSKEEAISLTLENNLGIKVAKNSLVINENNASILNSGYLPTLTGNAGGSINRQDTEGQLASV